MIQIKQTQIHNLKRIIIIPKTPKLLALILGLLLFIPHFTFASFQSVQINEINYIGYTIWPDDNNTDFNDEFIELKNSNPAVPISLSGWTLRIVSGAGDKTISLSGNITDYIVIRRIANSQTSPPPIDKVIDVKSTDFGSLSNNQNKGAYIELRNNLGVTIDSVNFIGQWPNNVKDMKETESLHKVSNLVWEVKPHSPLNITPAPTPTPTPTPTPEPEKINYGGVILSEIYPNPAEGGKEFVELYNTTDKDIDLANWKLDDIPSGGSTIQTLTGIIPANGFLVLEAGSGLKIGLNNDQDSVILYDPNSEIQSQVDYTMKDSQKGSSYMWFNNNWIWNTSPSPNTVNTAPVSDTVIITPITPTPVVPIPIPQLPSYKIGSIIINEIYPNPAEGGKEFVELYNTTDKDIDLVNWKLDDIPSGGSTIQSLAGVILAKGFMLLEKGLGLNIILNNDQDSVILYDPNGEIQSQVDYTMKDSQKGSSYMWFNNNWIWNTSPSPNTVNTAPVSDPVIITPTPVLPIPIPQLPSYKIGSIIISELYPYPTSGEEFIELYNTTEQDIDLTGWKIADLAKSYTLSGIIPAKSYKLYNQSETKIALNNTSETVTLTDNYNQIQSTTSYTKAYKGLSYIPVLQTWSWTQTLTPNEPNIFTEDTSSKDTKNYTKIENIENLSVIEDGEFIELEGQVIVPAGDLVDTSFYVIKDNRIVKVYDRQKRFPSLKSGSIVKVQAEWHSTDTQQYLKINSPDNIELISEQPITIKSETKKELEIADWGKIISVRGVLDTNTKTKLVINNKNQDIAVKLYANKIIKPKMKKGDIVTLTGFIEVYDGEIRLIPWDNKQIKVTPIIKKASANGIKLNTISEIDNNSSNPISNTNTEYRGLDEYQIPGVTETKPQNSNWLQEFISKYGLFSLAIILNLSWWGYWIWGKYRRIL